MATSGSTDFTISRDNIIYDVLSLYEVIESGGTPTTNQLADGNRFLNKTIKALQGMGVGLWLNTEVTMTLVVDQESYTLGPSDTTTTDPTTISKPLEIIEARYVDADDLETPMTIISRQEYMDISDKSTSGVPLMLYYDRQITNGVMYIWPTADTANSIKFTAKEQVEDFDAAADNPDFPPEWFRFVTYRLAVDWAPAFGISGQKLAELKGLRDEAEWEAEGFDVEDTSVFFGVDA